MLVRRIPVMLARSSCVKPTLKRARRIAWPIVAARSGTVGVVTAMTPGVATAPPDRSGETALLCALTTQLPQKTRPMATHRTAASRGQGKTQRKADQRSSAHQDAVFYNGRRCVEYSAGYMPVVRLISVPFDRSGVGLPLSQYVLHAPVRQGDPQ